jgi:uric acid-xanthine permease
MAIIARAPFNRRNRFILTASLSVGFGAILVPNWFSYVFTYKGNNRALMGFFDAIILVMETGFAVTALLALILNLSIGEEFEQDAVQLEGQAASKRTDERKSVDDDIIEEEKADQIKPEDKTSDI